MTRTAFHRLFGTCAALLALLPLGLFFVGITLPFWIVLPLNLIGWLLVSSHIVGLERLHQALDQAFARLNFLQCNDILANRVRFFIEEFGRYYRAAFAYQDLKLQNSGNNSKAAVLGLNLQRIVQLAYRELGAQAVELSLYDEDSGLWPQAIVVGHPTSSEVQSLTLQAQNINFDDSFVTKSGNNIVSAKVAFAGTTFGALRVEFPKGITPSDDDCSVLKLLAMQGALLLVDARYTDELVRMKRLNEESVKVKTGFLAQLSHEIRGPLGIILNGVELNLEGLCGPITDGQAETLKMIQESGNHLLDLVNDVLDFAKAEAGKITANPVSMVAKPFIKDLAAIIRNQAEEKHHRVVVEDIADSIGILCDKRHLRQMMINLLTNAVKYTPSGGTITLSCQRMPQGRVQISVTDTGVGIAPEEQHKVFGAFERVNNEYSLKQQGTGLGMPLTARLAEANGGFVDFTSAEGAGSTFIINLPIAETIAVEDSAAEQLEQKTNGAGDTVLIVDDNEDARKMLGMYLHDCGFFVKTAASGRAVLKAFKDGDVSIALIEADLSDISGEDVVAALRGSPLTQGVPIVLLSAKAFVFDIENYLRIGVDRCITKPFELKELARTIRELIDESRSGGA